VDGGNLLWRDVGTYFGTILKDDAKIILQTATSSVTVLNASSSIVNATSLPFLSDDDWTYGNPPSPYAGKASISGPLVLVYNGTGWAKEL
jgi:hypothetical protein